MKIVDVEYRGYVMDYEQPLRNGTMTYERSSLLFVRVQTDENIDGIGVFANPISIGGAGLMREAVAVLAARIRGLDPLSHEQIRSQCHSAKLFGTGGIMSRAASMIDIAIWDIRAKAFDVPLHVLLGGGAASVPVYFSGGYYDGPDHGPLMEEMKKFVEAGARAVKMKIGRGEMGNDVARVQAVRESIGDDVLLMLDANGAYTRHEAAMLCRRIVEFNPYLLEEPVPASDHDGYRVLSESTTIAIAGGENESTLAGFRQLLEQGKLDVINPDVTVVGGITEYVEIHALARAFGVSVIPHGLAEIHIPVAAGLAGTRMVEIRPYDRLRRIAFGDDWAISGGSVQPTERAGNGMAPDWERLEEFRVE